MAKDNVIYFVAFCVELYKNAHGISGARAAQDLSQHGVLEYLVENYEVLHTQSHTWILDEIENQMQE